MSIENFFWDEIEDNVVEAYDDNGVTVAEYTTEPTLYGTVISHISNGAHRFYHFDGIGNTSEITDDSTAITDVRRYSAFGEVSESIGSTFVPFQFMGMAQYYTDAYLGYYVRRRQYEPATSRWASIDPHISMANSSSYLFVGNSPLVWHDPSGEISVRIILNGSVEKCGNQVGFLFDFLVEAKVHPAGWLVQQIEWGEIVKSCFDCNSCPKGMTRANYQHKYWEAWHVSANQALEDDRRNGKFTYTDARTRLCEFDTCGVKIVGGQIKFYPEDITGDLSANPDWMYNNPLTQAGMVLSTIIEPPWFYEDKPLEGPAYVNVRMEWCCCDEEARVLCPVLGGKASTNIRN